MDEYCNVCPDEASRFNPERLSDRVKHLRDIETSMYLDANYRRPYENPLAWSGDVLYRQRGYVVPGP